METHENGIGRSTDSSSTGSYTLPRELTYKLGQTYGLGEGEGVAGWNEKGNRV
jgi:predicted double-glycine peptidase